MSYEYDFAERIRRIGKKVNLRLRGIWLPAPLNLRLLSASSTGI